MSNIPGWYALLLLTLGGFRIVRLVTTDTITEAFRTRLTGYDDEGAPSLSDDAYDAVTGLPEAHSRIRVYLSTLIRCPWCSGFWLSLILYGLWVLAPHATLVACVPLTLSALFGLIAKTDE